MTDLLSIVLDVATTRGASYADVRVVENTARLVSVRNGLPDAIGIETRSGFGVRVLLDGVFGFAASTLIDTEEAVRVTVRAVEIARETARISTGRLAFPVTQPVSARYETEYEEDPLTVATEDVLSLFDAAHRAMQSRYLAATMGSFTASRTSTTFASTEGSSIVQNVTSCGAGIRAFTTDGSDVQRRTYPGDAGSTQSGWESIRSLDLVGNAARVMEEAEMLLLADPCPSDVTTLVLGSDQVALQVHESIGHPFEADRILGSEISLAGASYISLKDIGKRVLGSELVTIVADATAPKGLGTFAYDDDGTPAQRVTLVEHGLVSGLLASREVSERLGIPNTGCARADGHARPPLVRMTNINLLPGDASAEELIGAVDRGVYMDVCKSWSIDDLRMNFQFAMEMTREIRQGALGRVFKSGNYTGITSDFWRSCSHVGDASTYRMWGFTNCGKGDPIQVMSVGHGAPIARFDDVRIGVIG